ncbi:MAG: Do family serine endopeptidase [Gemmatimonadetes bacterium]|nr:Do family serine endopeptidase [Gemmatimonadota bacterium]
MSASFRTRFAYALVAVTSLVLGVLLASNLGWTPGTLAQQGDAPVPAKQVEALEETSNAFISISRQITPAVVSIQSERLQTAQAPDVEVPAPFEDFFQFRGPQNQTPMPQTAGGTGFVVRPDGYILTNNHVVEAAEHIRVELPDKRQFPARVVGRDPTTDIAVLKIEAEGLAAATLGDSDDVQIGEWVLAIGNPGFGGSQGLNFTVTAGIVSARGRSLNLISSRNENPYAIEDFIQTDAAINPGNSGGPLVNIRGEVIGINTAIATRSGFYQGYGFAIPTNLARPAMEAIIRTGHVERAVLGIQIKAMDQGFAEAAGLDRVTGVFVDGFAEIPQNPAREAGLQPRDVILTVEGQDVRSTADLQQKIAFRKPGDTVKLGLWRDGDREEVEVRLARRPDAPEEEEESRAAMTTNKLGMEVRELTPADVQSLELDNAEGVIVSQVRPFSPAWDTFPLASRVPVIITEIGGKRIRNLQDYQQVVDALKPGQTVYVKRKLRDGDGIRETYATLKIPE